MLTTGQLGSTRRV